MSNTCLFASTIILTFLLIGGLITNSIFLDRRLQLDSTLIPVEATVMDFIARSVHGVHTLDTLYAFETESGTNGSVIESAWMYETLNERYTPVNGSRDDVYYNVCAFSPPTEFAQICARPLPDELYRSVQTPYGLIVGEAILVAALLLCFVACCYLCGFVAMFFLLFACG